MSDVQMVRFDTNGHKIIGTIYDLWRRLDYTKSVLKKSSHDINCINQQALLVICSILNNFIDSLTQHQTHVENLIIILMKIINDY